MKYFVLWSGGLDSTYLVYKLLKEGHEVFTAYVKIDNNITKVKRELKAIKKIKSYFEKFNTYKHLYTVLSVDVKSNHVQTDLSHPPIWILGILVGLPIYVNRVAIAYVMNDDAISYLNDIQKIYNSYKQLCCYDNLPKLEFPLTKFSKLEIIRNLSQEPKILKNITFCENIDKKDNCGLCIPCKKWKRLEEDESLPEEAYRFTEPKIITSEAKLIKEVTGG